MYNGERPLSTAKGKQPDTEALCQPPPPLETVAYEWFVVLFSQSPFGGFWYSADCVARWSSSLWGSAAVGGMWPPHTLFLREVPLWP